MNPFPVAATAIDLGPAIQQIGIGALIAAPAYAMLRVIWLKSEKQSAELSQSREDAISREREFSTGTVPVLQECVRALTEVAKATEEQTMLRKVEAEIAKRRDR